MLLFKFLRYIVFFISFQYFNNLNQLWLFHPLNNIGNMYKKFIKKP